ncbi:hypothetical protein DFAR_2910054 [Desulfarculales bacterium]
MRGSLELLILRQSLQRLGHQVLDVAGEER